MKRRSLGTGERFEHFICRRVEKEPRDCIHNDTGPCVDWDRFEGSHKQHVGISGSHKDYLESTGFHERSTKTLGLMRCCRMMYVLDLHPDCDIATGHQKQVILTIFSHKEIIPLIYTRLHFHFKSPMHLLQVYRLMPRHRFLDIKFLSLGFHPAKFCPFQREAIDTALVYDYAFDRTSRM